MKAIEISVLWPARRPASGRAPGTRSPGAGEVLIRVTRQRHQPPGRAAAHGQLPGAAGRFRYSGAGSRWRDRRRRRAGDGGCGIQAGRPRLCAGRRRRLRAAVRGAGGPVPAGAQGLERRRGGLAAGDLLHRVEQRVRPRPPAARRNPADPGRLQRHRRDRHPDGQGAGRQGDRHRRQRRQVRGLPEARRRPRHQLQDRTTSPKRPRSSPAARAST